GKLEDGGVGKAGRDVAETFPAEQSDAGFDGGLDRRERGVVHVDGVGGDDYIERFQRGGIIDVERGGVVKIAVNDLGDLGDFFRIGLDERNAADGSIAERVDDEGVAHAVGLTHPTGSGGAV